MRHIPHRSPAPDCLEEEKNKKNGEYNCGEVIPLLAKDFFNKCYLCEQDLPTDINIEHFIPKKLGKSYKFDWLNLFYACGTHCNQIKSDDYNTNANNQILNCTNSAHNVTGGIQYRIIDFVKKEAQFTANNQIPATLNSIDLLEKIFGVQTVTTRRKVQAHNLIMKIAKEMVQFTMLFEDYDEAIPFKEWLGQSGQKVILKALRNRLQKDSPFTAFKIWYLIDNFGKHSLELLLDSKEYETYFKSLDI